VDQNGGATMQWSNITTQVGTDTIIGKGKSNTAAIISQGGHINSAAKVCRDYRGGGYSDWFLPSQDEMLKIGVNMNRGTNDDSGNATYTPVGNFVVSRYWSSTDSLANAANFIVSLNNIGSMPKTDSYYVRAIRAF
jgi:molybdenum-dependent DNA-binding transcriptional regulator ModE